MARSIRPLVLGAGRTAVVAAAPSGERRRRGGWGPGLRALARAPPGLTKGGGRECPPLTEIERAPPLRRGLASGRLDPGRVGGDRHRDALEVGLAGGFDGRGLSGPAP